MEQSKYKKKKKKKTWDFWNLGLFPKKNPLLSNWESERVWAKLMGKKAAMSSPRSRRLKKQVGPPPPPPLLPPQIRGGAASPPNNNNCSLVGKGKKKTGGARLWMRLDRSGRHELMELDKNAIIRRASIPARDLRILGPIFSHSSNILGILYSFTFTIMLLSLLCFDFDFDFDFGLEAVLVRNYYKQVEEKNGFLVFLMIWYLQ